jgi:hypothetical protein
VSERYGPWVVVGEPTARALLVQHVDEPSRRGRLRPCARVASGPSPWSTDELPSLEPWPAGVVRVLERNDEYWVLDDAEDLGLGVVLAEAGPLELDEAALLVFDTLEPLSWLHQALLRPVRTLHLDALVLDAAGTVRLLPPLPSSPPALARVDGVPRLECLAPEVVRGLPPSDLTMAADVYSVACLAHRLLGGAWPHQGDVPMATLKNIVDGHITRPLAELRPGLPAAVVELLERAASVEPGRRPPSCAALGEPLRALLPFDPERGRAQLVRRFADCAGRAQTIPAPPPPPPAPRAVAPAPPPEPARQLDLPRALEPWREALQLFAPDLALSVGDVVRRVARLFGPLTLDADVQRGDPDGYRGVARRGPIERLLLSEWAVLLEYPEEFLRRVAMGEQLYTALAHKEPGGLRRSIVLFDAGPRSLGAPRVVQLALLIVLAARARAAGVRFTWGVLQDERRALVAELNEQSVRRLLSGRALRELGGVDATEWSLVVGEPQESDDLWLVGPRGLDERIALGGGGRVVLEDSDDPERRVVQVEVRPARGPVRALELPLPPEDDVLRLLREPFVRRVRAPRVAPAGPRPPLTDLAFEPSGRWLIERYGTREVVATFVPRSTRETRPAPLRRVAKDGELILGATMWRNRLHTVETSALGLTLQRSGPHGGEAGAWALEGVLPPQEELDVVAVLGARVPERVYLRTLDGTLYSGVLGAIERDAAPCGGLTQVRPDAVVYSTLPDDHWSVRAERLGFDTQRALGRWPRSSSGALVLGVAGPSEGVAIQVSPTTYAYVGARSPLPEVPAGCTVVGTAFRGGMPHLVLLDADRRTFRLLGVSGGHALHTAPADVVQVAPNSKYELLAYVDARGALRVLGLDGAVVFERL